MKISVFLGATALAGSLLIPVVGASAQTAPSTGQNAPTTRGTEAQTVPTTRATEDSTSSTATASEQAENPTGVDGSNGNDLIVTGSRLRGARLSDGSAVPVTTITAAELLGTRGDTSLGDTLNQLPQLRSTFSQANSTGSIGTAGLNLLDLRGLGTARTLVLVNGRRVVSAVPGSYTPDINTIPIDLVERTDLVTGGNSAIYGSDAIAGVVNFVLKRSYDGIKLRAQGGVTSYGDRGTYLVSGIAGKSFFDGRLNVMVTGEYTKAQPLFYSQRSYLGATTGTPGFITSQITTAPNRNFDGIPNTQFNGSKPGSTFGTISLGSAVATSCPAATTTNALRRSLVCTGQTTPTGGALAYYFDFAPDGTLVRDDASTGLIDRRNIGGGFLGGLSASGVEDAMLNPGLDRYAANIIINSDFSTAFKPFLEGSFTRVNALQQSTQPTFISGTLSPTFSINNPFLTTQARTLLTQILAPGATTFNLQRFNNDFGTRAEQHTRDTYRAVVGASGDLSTTGNLHYEVAFNYGRTENYYETGGNVLLANYNKAVNAVRNSSGQIVCGVNADAITTNDDAACAPLNIFGYRAPSQAALNYILYKSSRRQWAEEIDATAFISGDSSGLFTLPGGPVSVAIGGEYRTEDAYSAYDPVTASGATFLNAAAPFDPPKVKIKEGFGELRVPLLKDIFLIKEFTLEGSGRVSDYGGNTGSVVAWNAGATWRPVRDLAFQGTLSRSVRAPNLSNLYATAGQTFATFTDPCDQPGGNNGGNNITTGPNRAANCAAAGIPTTITYADPTNPSVLITRPWTNQATSTIAGINSGNPNLVPEIGYSFTASGSFTPSFLPGFSFKATYYNIRVKNVISGLTGQAIINRCYDDPGGINNPFCAVIFRRNSTDPIANLTFNGQNGRVLDSIPNQNIGTAGNGVSFINQPFNFAKLATRGLDFDAAYRHKFQEDFGINLRVSASYVMDRLSYGYITEPTRYDRIDSTLGDPKWQGVATAAVNWKQFNLSYNARYVGKQIVSALAYETFFPSQGRPATNPDARPFIYYDPIVYHNARLTIDVNERFRFYTGMDNITNKRPPYDLTGTGNDAIYPNIGRFFYSGIEAKF